MVGVLLGKHGQTLKNLMAESGATIDIDQSTHVHGYSVVHIKRGPGAAKARGLIDAKLCETQTLDRESKTRLGPFQDRSSKDQFPTQTKLTHKEVKVAQGEVSKLVGPKGSVLRLIEEQSGARLQFDQSTQSKGYSTLSIRGRDISVSFAYKLVVARLPSEQTEMLSRRVPQEYVGGLIGYRGENLIRMKDSTGLHIQIDQSTRDKGYSTIYVPDVEGAGKVQEMINDALADLGYVDEGTTHKQPVETMNIDNYLVDCVRGEHRQAIEYESGAALSLDQTTWDAGYVVLELEGSLRSVQRARKLVEERMRDLDKKVKARGRRHSDCNEQDRHAFDAEESLRSRAPRIDEAHKSRLRALLSSKARVRKANSDDSSDLNSSRMSDKAEATPSEDAVNEAWDERSGDDLQTETHEHRGIPSGSSGQDANSGTGRLTPKIEAPRLAQESPRLCASNSNSKNGEERSGNSSPCRSSVSHGQSTPEKIADHVNLDDEEQKVGGGSMAPSSESEEVVHSKHIAEIQFDADPMKVTSELGPFESSQLARECDEHAESITDHFDNAPILHESSAEDLSCTVSHYQNYCHEIAAGGDNCETNVVSEEAYSWCDDTSWSWWAPETSYDWSMMGFSDENCWDASWYSSDLCDQWMHADYTQSTLCETNWPRLRARDSKKRATEVEYSLDSLEGEWLDDLSGLSYRIVPIGTSVQVQSLRPDREDPEPSGSLISEDAGITWERPDKSKYSLTKVGTHYLIWKHEGCVPLKWHRVTQLKNNACVDGEVTSQAELKSTQNPGETRRARSTSRGTKDTAEMRVEQDYVSWIIGRSGGVINDISCLTGTNLNFDQSTQAQGYSTLQITGSSVGTKQALQLVAAKLDEAKQKEKVRTSSAGRHRTPPPSRSARERSRERGDSATRSKKSGLSDGQEKMSSLAYGTCRWMSTGANQMLRSALQTLLGSWTSEDSEGKSLMHKIELQPAISGGAKLACRTWSNEYKSDPERPIRTEGGDILLGEDSRFYLDAITEKHLLWVDESNPEVFCHWTRTSNSRRGGQRADGSAIAGSDLAGSAARRNSGSRQGMRMQGRAPSLPSRQRSREPRVRFSSVGAGRSQTSDVTLQRGSVEQNSCM
eukprot:TRINITY_DN14300_c0_g3_i1.p1 TRINITY_DN14300_c0_g3~~TRINITY_DN14300_c0_g3_i1.p1  ORF type:complete len:1227 (+),score=134.21 TRINITY_DN14300_c0_g3_i1:330-3683(+)